MLKVNKHLIDSINEFSEQATKQEGKGLKKYGKHLDPLDNYDWLAMAKEELADAFKYLHAEEVKRKFVAGRIKELTKDNEIHELLDYLTEGGVHEVKNNPM